uniref:Uncharacterized protein n=1 Tax=Romanomermis culicivorax TaxID=13658 RepID=A0A915L3J1_ROMCU
MRPKFPWNAKLKLNPRLKFLRT